MKPFLRWAGGKRWLVPALAPRIVSAIGTAGRYIEPFLGAGAVALALAENDKLAGQTLLLGDYCEPLVRTWEWIIKSPQSVDRELQRLVEAHGRESAGYAAVREIYNTQRGQLVRAAAFLYLNATSFNGLYRENARGLYNTPHGRTKTPFMSLETMTTTSSLLSSRARLSIGDFEALVDQARFGDVVYADPPYDQVYGDYTSRGFSSDDQIRLAKALKRATHRGATIFASNSDTPLIRDSYRWASLEAVSEARAIAAAGSSRTSTKCLLIEGKPEV